MANKISGFTKCYHCDSYFSDSYDTEEYLVSFRLEGDDEDRWRHGSLVDCIKALGQRIESLENAAIKKRRGLL